MNEFSKFLGNFPNANSLQAELETLEHTLQGFVGSFTPHTLFSLLIYPSNAYLVGKQQTVASTGRNRWEIQRPKLFWQIKHTSKDQRPRTAKEWNAELTQEGGWKGYRKTSPITQKEKNLVFLFTTKKIEATLSWVSSTQREHIIVGSFPTPTPKKKSYDSCRQEEDITLPPPRRKLLLWLCLSEPCCVLYHEKKGTHSNHLYVLKGERLRVGAKHPKLWSPL